MIVRTREPVQDGIPEPTVQSAYFVPSNDSTHTRPFHTVNATSVIRSRERFVFRVMNRPPIRILHSPGRIAVTGSHLAFKLGKRHFPDVDLTRTNSSSIVSIRGTTVEIVAVIIPPPPIAYDSFRPNEMVLPKPIVAVTRSRAFR